MTKTFVGPGILIVFGIIFLLNNFGILPWDVWLSLWKFWPIILILVGVEILLGKPASIKTFVVLFGLVFLVPIILSYNPITNNPLATEEFEIAESLGVATSAKIILELPASTINIGSLEGSSAFLTQGKIVYSEAAKKPSVEKKETGGKMELTLTQSTQGKLPFISNLKTNANLSLTSLIPLEIFIKTGASTANIDLSKLKSEYLEVNSGASSLNIKLADNFSQKILIKAGASSITLEIPVKLESKVTVDSQVKSVAAPERFKKTADTYQTKDFEKANVRGEIEIKSAAGSITIK
ncbi:MAG: DUF5668 domain-containing protein [Candidatus Woykebacteria bacterium]